MSTHTAISYHIVFSTQDRAPVLHRDRRSDLFRYIWGIISNREGHLYRINGVSDGPVLTNGLGDPSGVVPRLGRLFP